MQRLDGIRAVITGGTTGIGYAAAHRLIEEGARVILTGQNQGRIDDATARLGERAQGFLAQAESPEDASALADFVKTAFGGLDVLFANAGVAWPTPFDAVDLESLQRQMAINFAGPLFAVQKLAPLMGEGASVIFNTSNLNELGMPGMAVYSASKAALRSLARTLQTELEPKGIRVNTVAPGPVETPIYGKLDMPEEQLDAMAQQILAKVPAGRFGKPEEIAGAVAFLASPDSSFMRGAEVTVDGGWSSL
ncbi:MAG: SDR family oxidoreductase [Alphaproteobacteria bacterium]|nr:SDR family oxidoreductase [Alphaproteobacteria bacterium]